MVMSFSGGVAERQAELDAVYGPGRIRVEQVRYSNKELVAFSAPVGHMLGGDALVIGVSPVGRANRVEVYLGRLDVATATAVLAVIKPEQVCFGGPYPDQLVPEGPQRSEGVGWRLLASGPGAVRSATAASPSDVSVEAALDRKRLDALWPQVGANKTQPSIDFDDQAVFVFNVGHDTCGPERLDGFTIEGTIVFPTLVQPGPAQSCGQSFSPYYFVVAVDRADMPAGPFTMHTQRPRRGCPDCGIGSIAVTVR